MKECITRRSLRAARIMRGLDQVQLARAVGLKQPDISYFETGRRLPNRKQAGRICRVLEVDPKAVFPELFPTSQSRQSRESNDE